MIKIAICDDNLIQLEYISNKVKEILDDNDYIVNSFSSSYDLIKYLENEEADILCLDIYMPDTDGFTIAQEYKNRYKKLIFISCMDKLVYESFKFSPFRFVRKSCINDLEEAILKAINEIEKETKKIYVITIDGKIIMLNELDIIYIEADKHNLNLFTVKGKYTIRTKISEFYVKLNQKYFYRVQKSFIVNLLKIENLNFEKITLLYNDEYVKISIRRGIKKDLLKKLAEALQ